MTKSREDDNAERHSPQPGRVTTIRRFTSIFASGADDDRQRRPADALKVISGALLITAASLEITRFSSFLDALTASGQTIPRWLATMSGGALALSGVFVMVLMVLAILSRSHWRLARDLVVGAVVAGVSGVAVSHWALGETTSADALFSTGHHFPELRVLFVTTLVLIATPFVILPARRVAHLMLAIGVVSGIALRLGNADSVIGAFGLGVAIAGIVHLIFCSSGGALSTQQVHRVLASYGWRANDLVRVSGRTPGAARYVMSGDDGALLSVEVFGRDAADLQGAARLWRLAWYRDNGPSVAGRLQQAEHRALMDLLALRAGASVPDVALVTGTERGDGLLVTSQVGGSTNVIAWSRDLAVRAWREIELVHRAGVSLGGPDQQTFSIDRLGHVFISPSTTARLEPSAAGIAADRAGLLVLTSLSLGADAAIETALGVLALEDLQRLLPHLQGGALSATVRSLVRRRHFDLKDLRQRAAQRCDTELPPLEQLHRVSLRSLLSTFAGIFAAWVLVTSIAKVDFASVGEVLRGSTWSWVVAALVIGQLARVGCAISIIGATEFPLALGPTWLLQMAISFIGLVVPGSAARLGTSMRFYQKQGAEGTEAMTASVLDSLSGLVVQLVVLLLTIGLGWSTMTFSSAELDFALPVGKLLVLAAIGLVVGLFVVLSVRRLRAWVRRLVATSVRSARSLRSARRITMLFGGNLGTELALAIALGFCVLAVGYRLPFVDLITINVVVALFAGLMPVPGGIGVTEAALAGSLALAGMPEGPALAAALLYRAVTYYLPPLWGYFAMRWLTRHDYL